MSDQVETPTVDSDAVQKLMFLREHAVGVLADVGAGNVDWIVQRSASYGRSRRTCSRCTKTVRYLADMGAVSLPPRSGQAVITDVGREVLKSYPASVVHRSEG